MSDNIPPEWARVYFNDCRDLLGIGLEWNLYFEVADDPEGDKDADGTCDLNPRYLIANIKIRRGLDEERGKEVIMHELLHVALARLDQVQHRLVDLIKPKQRDHALDLYKDAEEATIQSLMRALQRSVKPKATE